MKMMTRSENSFSGAWCISLILFVTFGLIHSAIIGNDGKVTPNAEKDKLNASSRNKSLSVRMGNRQALINDLFHEYDKRNYPIPGKLNFGLTLLRFNVDPENNLVDLDVWLTSSWFDPRLSWDSEYYAEKNLKLSPDDVWTPDVSLYNTAEPQSELSCQETNVVIDYTGNLEWIPPCKLKAYCQLNFTAHPLTEQKCILKFGSWIFDGFELDLQFYAGIKGVDMSNYSDLTNWNVTESRAFRETKSYSCCPEPYVTLNYEFTFHRKNDTKI